VDPGPRRHSHAGPDTPLLHRRPGEDPGGSSLDQTRMRSYVLTLALAFLMVTFIELSSPG